ncbi:MCM DNA helicase complex subunit [Friedmanniomyces endolithicus]|nr:MCM DNA helicase complex subunit [Friedmanniomyces endolithicus]
MKCGIKLGPFPQDSSPEVKLCFRQNWQPRGTFTVNSEKTVSRNYQKLHLQESLDNVPAGRLPRHREVMLLWDLIDSAKPGAEVEITGIYRNNYDAQLRLPQSLPPSSKPTTSSKPRDQLDEFRLTKADEREIRALRAVPKSWIRSCSVLRPPSTDTPPKRPRLRFPFRRSEYDGAGKAQHMQGHQYPAPGRPGDGEESGPELHREHRAPRCLCYRARRFRRPPGPSTQEWTLEGGALVLADRGVFLIDEFDKMNDQNQTSIHEIMEQQTVSISKAVWRYNGTVPFSQNHEPTEPILPRFDILCVVRDTVDPAEDERIANFVVKSHGRAQPVHSSSLSSHIQSTSAAAAVNAEGSQAIDVDGQEAAAVAAQRPTSPILQELLRKHILYAREHCRPKLYQIDQDKIARLFADMRRESLAPGAYPITETFIDLREWGGEVVDRQGRYGAGWPARVRLLNPYSAPPNPSPKCG